MVSCLPVNYGCERPNIEPFVDHLNQERGTAYRFVKCLDKQHHRPARPEPQPEALYVDLESSAQLVIEHKLVTWPIDFVEAHRVWHGVQQHLFKLLVPRAVEGKVWVVCIPNVLPRKPAAIKQELKFIEQSTDDPRLLQGQRLSRVGAAFHWELLLRDVSPSDRGRVLVCTPGEMTLFTFNEEDTKSFNQNVQRLVTKAKPKFAAYPSALKVLLLERHGDFFTPLFDYSALDFSGIDEVWECFRSWDEDEGEEYWAFESMVIEPTAA